MTLNLDEEQRPVSRAIHQHEVGIPRIAHPRPQAYPVSDTDGEPIITATYTRLAPAAQGSADLIGEVLLVRVRQPPQRRTRFKPCVAKVSF